MAVVLTLWLRELKRYWRSPAQILSSLGPPLMYLLALGFGLNPVFQQSGHGSYVQFVAPGIVGMAILFSSVLSGLVLLWDRRFGVLKATLVAPVPRIQIMAGRTLGGATVAVIQGALVLTACVLAGFRPDVTGLPLALVFMGLIGIVFSALGLAIGAMLRELQGFQLMVNLVVMPLFFLSGALYPLAKLPAALAVATRLDPFTYGVDGLRTVMTGISFIGVATDLSVLALLTVIFVAVGARAFSNLQA